MIYRLLNRDPACGEDGVHEAHEYRVVRVSGESDGLLKSQLFTPSLPDNSGLMTPTH